MENQGKAAVQPEGSQWEGGTADVVEKAQGNLPAHSLLALCTSVYCSTQAFS